MPTSCPTSDEIVAQKLEDGKDATLTLTDMRLFACGVFSNVYRGTAKDDNNEIVIKKTWPSKKSFPTEVKILGILGKMKHKNVIRLLYSYQKAHADRICLGLIFECIPYNLHQFIKEQERQIDIIEVKLITWQLFRGQAHLQRMKITHRDIKPQNLLFEPQSGLLKIADFGSSTDQPAKVAQTSYHVTRYYRPPELILGSHYGPQLDIWSCGCVFGELLKGDVMLRGGTSDHQGEIIFDMIGVPTKDDLKAMQVNKEKYERLAAKYKPDPTKCTLNMAYLFDHKPAYQKERKTRVQNHRIELSEMKESVELLREVLSYNPMKRLCGTELLMDAYFIEVMILFDDNTVRYNNKKIGCITQKDYQNVKNGDRAVTHETTAD
ncbi:hypothetical protein CAEBREN_18833 [Caenorhabditis brenneri]|uniref:Protein kinase domain-containing protein n=1 Tax=Caenorhabditis brenneri TaxID=135651 RepID=G0MVP3_CAEBE|nr:hypothetical protein CAEBREN_18833 [Caenorhabditis brenneri]